jgi:hypothetical protein
MHQYEGPDEYEGLDGADRRREMAQVLDIRDAREVVRRLDQARGRLAAEAGVPAEVIALVSEIEIALADSGPLEIGVSAEAFVTALETSRRIRLRLDAADAVTQHRQMVRTVRKLRRRFKLADIAAHTTRRRCAAAGFLLLAGLTGVYALDQWVVFGLLILCEGLWIASWIASLPIGWVQARRAKVARVVMAPAPADTLLLCVRPVQFSVRKRRIWIVTDQRLLLAEGARWRPIRSVRSVEYPQITALSCEQSQANMCLELRVGSEQFDLTLERTLAKALLAILCRRTGLPVLLPASRYADWRNDIDGAVRHRRSSPARASALTSCPQKRRRQAVWRL